MRPVLATEKAPGIFQGLKDGGTYWVYVSRDAEEEEKDRERMRQVCTHTTSCVVVVVSGAKGAEKCSALASNTGRFSSGGI